MMKEPGHLKFIFFETLRLGWVVDEKTARKLMTYDPEDPLSDEEVSFGDLQPR